MTLKDILPLRRSNLQGLEVAGSHTESLRMSQAHKKTGMLFERQIFCLKMG